MTHSRSVRVLLLFFMGTLFLSAIPASSAQESKSHDIFLVFDGPWAITPDPEDVNKVIAIAPVAAHHRPLYVQSHNTTVGPGIYELSFPAPANSRPSAGTPEMDPDILQTTISAANVQHAFNSQSPYYAIRLPKPEAYLAELRYRSRVGPSYPPSSSFERNYASTISLRYRVSTLKGFALTSAPDSGQVSSAFPVQVASPTIQFVIDADRTSGADLCHTHERATFHSLVSLLSLDLFIDFPGDSNLCRANDPQNLNHAHVENRQTFPAARLSDLVEHETSPQLIRVGRGSNCRVVTIVARQAP